MSASCKLTCTHLSVLVSCTRSMLAGKQSPVQPMQRHHICIKILHTKFISDFVSGRMPATHAHELDLHICQCCCREAAASSASKGRKKTPEELSVEVLLHFAGTVRAFYASVAKAVHAQARRRDDPAFQPNASMKAASVTLGVILKCNLDRSNQVTEVHKNCSSLPLEDNIVQDCCLWHCGK